MKWLARIFGKRENARQSTANAENEKRQSGPSLCSVCAQPIAGPAIQHHGAGTIICHGCYETYGLANAQLGPTDVDSCPQCGYKYLPGWAPWFRDADKAQPQCPACRSRFSQTYSSATAAFPAGGLDLPDDTLGNRAAKLFLEGRWDEYHPLLSE